MPPGSKFLLAFQVLEIVAHLIDSLAIGSGVAIRKEMGVAIMGRLNSARVLDGAPVLLGSTRDFHHVCQQPVRIGAVQAIEAFNCVQIPQSVPVNRQIITASRLWYSVHREADGLVRRNEEIQQRKRNDQHVNERPGQARHEPGIYDILEERRLYPQMLPLDFLGEPYLSVTDLVEMRLDLLLQ